MARTLTGANSVFILNITNLFPYHRVQGYAVDDAFAAEAQDVAEVVMGVDGLLGAGWVANPVKMTVMLQAHSVSQDVFDAWGATQEQAREIVLAQGTILLPAIGKGYVCNNGVLTSVKKFPDVKKMLQPVPWAITWESVKPAVI